MKNITVTGRNGTLKEMIKSLTFSTIISKFNMSVLVAGSQTIITIMQKKNVQLSPEDITEIEKLTQK